MSEITQERMESAMTYLAQTDLEFAEEKTQLMRHAILQKRIRSRVFLTSTGTVAEREAKAEASADAEAADADYCTTLARFEHLRAKRQRAEILIDVWRSVEASRRKA